MAALWTEPAKGVVDSKKTDSAPKSGHRGENDEGAEPRRERHRSQTAIHDGTGRWSD